MPHKPKNPFHKSIVVTISEQTISELANSQTSANLKLSDQRSLMLSTPTTFNPTFFNASSPLSIASFQPASSLTPTSPTSSDDATAYHFPGIKKSQLIKSNSMVNMRSSYDAFERNLGDDNNKRDNLELPSSSGASTTNEATSFSEMITSVNSTSTLENKNSNSAMINVITSVNTNKNKEKNEQIVSRDGVVASGNNNLNYGIVSSSGPTDTLAMNNVVYEKNRFIYRSPIRKWRSFSSFYDNNSRTNRTTTDGITLRGIREEEINEVEKEGTESREGNEVMNLKGKRIRNLRETKYLGMGEESGSERNRVGIEDDKEDISEESSAKDDVRAVYEYYQVTLPKGDVSSDQFCGTVDRYGFIVTEDEESEELPDLTPHEIRLRRKEAQRSEKWIKWISASKFVKKSGKFGISNYVFPWDTKFQNRIYKGIPDSWRQPVWYFLLTNGGSESEFDDNLIRTYNTLLTQPSPHERQIDMDILRTLNSHIMFRTRYGPGQRASFNVLRAFSNYDKQVGYCQGMTSIVAILLMYYAEEGTFVMLTKLFTRCNLHNLYIPGFPALLESFHVQEKLMILYAPKISEKFNQLQITCTAYATRWYITLFTGDVVPHHTVLRIWDLLMLNGFDVLYFVAVALLKYHKTTLLKSTFECIMLTLSATLLVDDDDRLIRKVCKLYERRGRKRLVDTLKAEYRSQSN